MTNKKLDAVGVLLLTALVFLLPIFFIPSQVAPVQGVKLFLLVVGVLVPALLWTIARLKENSIVLPQALFALPLIALPLIALFASLFSGNILNSLVGNGIDTDTGLMMLVLVLSFCMGALLFNTKDKVFKLYLALVASFFIVCVYQAIRLFSGADFLSFNVFFGNTANLVGKWNDLALYAGLIGILSLTTLDILRPKGVLKVIFTVSLCLALLMLIVVNFPLVWVVLASISFLLFMRSFFKHKFFGGEVNSEDGGSHMVSGYVLAVFLVSILFIFSGSAIEQFTNTQLGISQVEARPSLQSTLTVAQEVYRDSSIFGAGPNNFTQEWLLHKPSSVNSTPFWNTDFLFGVGTIPTLFITHGLLSIISWVMFLGLFLWAGLRLFVRLDLKVFDNYVTTSSFLSALFLWAVSIFYVPHISLFFLAFFFSGISVATQVQVGALQQKIFEFNKNLRVGFIGVVLLFILLLGIVMSLYVSTRNFVSSVYVEKARVNISLTRDIVTAEKNINRAQIFSNHDSVFRASSEISLFKLNALVERGENTADTQREFQSILTQALGEGQNAVRFESRNYKNWVALGRIYESLVPLQIEGAYENARVAYEQALSLNPKNPAIALYIARVEVLNGSNDRARERIADALIMKNNYTDAIYLLSQIEISEGNVSSAIESIETASFLSPQDPLVFFQLGILKFSEEDHAGAQESLERAVLLDADYSNARYFLGLSYFESGKLQEALDQFLAVKRLNPGNAEITEIIANLSAGREPFNNAPTSAEPFEGFGLPIEE
ncbi:MAG: tetratricopeptide repeat protein [Candidatus Paceibacterota bacterium]